MSLLYKRDYASSCARCAEPKNMYSTQNPSNPMYRWISYRGCIALHIISVGPFASGVAASLMTNPIGSTPCAWALTAHQCCPLPDPRARVGLNPRLQSWLHTPHFLSLTTYGSSEGCFGVTGAVTLQEGLDARWHPSVYRGYPREARAGLRRTYKERCRKDLPVGPMN